MHCDNKFKVQHQLIALANIKQFCSSASVLNSNESNNFCAKLNNFKQYNSPS